MEIKRAIIEKLKKWKDSPSRKPLLLNGVRQCGKSWVLDRFGRTSFKNVVVLNFEGHDELNSFFEHSLSPRDILPQLRAYTSMPIEPNETLLVFDEVQLCPRAITSLKYFCEEAREYAVVAAGSLLGIALAANASFPVGKVDIIEMNPCSFNEYLNSVEPGLAEYALIAPIAPLPSAFEIKFTKRLKEYLALGGMPEVLSDYIDFQDAVKSDGVMDTIVKSYEADFAKHVPSQDVSKICLLWDAIPRQFAHENRRFFYGEVREGARAKDFECALQWLLNARLVRKVERAEIPELPLKASVDRKAFKLYLNDVGVLRKAAKLPVSIIPSGHDLFSDFKGRLTENFVLQQLNALGMDPVCYWYNSGGAAEVDFLIQFEDLVVPIEVKSGLSLNAKSLKTYRAKYKPELAVRLSLQNLRFDDGLLNVPLYLVGELPRLLALARKLR